MSSSSIRQYEVVMLAIVLWREARGEQLDGKIAVASSIMNRVAKPSWWGKNLIDVLTKKWQYSSLTDPKDKQLTTWPSVDDKSFIDCLLIAEGMLEGVLKPTLRGADSYYDDSLQGDARPKWAKDHPMRFVAKVGRLNFYNMDQDVECTNVQLAENNSVTEKPTITG